MSSIASDKKVWLLTGGPGVGKTTIIRRVLREARPSAGGFYTEEIRLGGVREGFRIVTLDGSEAVLAHERNKGRHRVGKYGVDVAAMDTTGVPAIRDAVRSSDVVVIDEIGRMELFSSLFRSAVTEALDSGRKVIGTIMLAPDAWADGVKRRPDVEIVPVTRSNHEEVVRGLVGWLNT